MDIVHLTDILIMRYGTLDVDIVVEDEGGRVDVEGRTLCVFESEAELEEFVNEQN